MQLVYLRFNSIVDLKKFTDTLPNKKVFIMFDQKVLMAKFSQREIDLALKTFAAKLMNMNPQFA